MNSPYSSEGKPNEDDKADSSDVNTSSTADSTSGYYALLNVSKAATSEEIRLKYRELAVLLHPDKQTDDAHKKLATEQFQRVKQAYQVLSDPQRRAIYDEFGEAGIEYASRVGQKLKTTEEMLAEIEKLSRSRALQGRSITSRNFVEVDVDARSFDIMSSNELLRNMSFLDRFDDLRVTGFSLGHTLNIPYGVSGMLSLSGRLASRQRGNLSGTIRHQVSPSILVNASLGLFDPNPLSVTTTWTPTPLTELKIKTNVSRRRPFPPSFSFGWSRRLSKQVTGTLSYHTGWPPVPTSTGLLFAPSSSFEAALSSNNQWSSSFEMYASSGRTVLTVQRSFVLSDTTTFELIARVDPLSPPAALQIALGATQDWKDLVRGGLRINLTIAFQLQGIVLQLKMSRAGESLTIPIPLSDEPNTTFALLTTAISALLLASAEFSLLNSARNRMRQAERRKREATLLERQRRAEGEIAVIRESILKRAEQEKARQGLVILGATYGPASSSTRSESASPSPEVIDVTIALQALVHNSQLNIPAGSSKSLLLGFYDPAHGRKKVLRVEYAFRGEAHATSVEDTGGLVLPVRGHRMVVI